MNKPGFSQISFDTTRPGVVQCGAVDGFVLAKPVRVTSVDSVSDKAGTACLPTLEL
jgi:hypothetical protein